METNEETLLRDILIGARRLMFPCIELDTSLAVSQRLDEYNASISKIRADVIKDIEDGKTVDGVPWGNHVLQPVGNFQIRTCPMVNYYRFYSCKFAQEDSFHNYVMIDGKEFDLPPTSVQGLSKADLAILSAAKHVLLNVKPPQDGLHENHRITVIQFFISNVVAGTEHVVTGDNEVFSTWGVETTRVRAFSYDPALIKAAYELSNAIRESDASLASKLKIGCCYIRYLEEQLGVLKVSELSMNTGLYAEIIYYTQILALATRAVSNVDVLVPDWFRCGEERADVHYYVDLSGAVLKRYQNVKDRATTGLGSADHISKKRRLEFSQEKIGESASASNKQGKARERKKTNSDVETTLMSHEQVEPINWLWTRNTRGNDIERKWNADAHHSAAEFEVAHMPEGEDFTVGAIRELLYNKQNHEDKASRDYMEIPDWEIVGMKKFKFGARNTHGSPPSFTLTDCSVGRVLIYIIVQLAKNTEITLEWSGAVANCLSIIGSPVSSSASVVGTSLNAGQLLQCYQHFVRPILQEALKFCQCDKHEVRVDLHGYGDYVEDKFRAIASVYSARTANRAPVRHQAVNTTQTQRYAGPDIDFKYYTVKEIQHVKDYLTHTPDRKLSTTLGSERVTFSINRQGQIKMNDIFTIVKRLLPDEVTVGPPFAKAKWILPDRTGWDTSIADIILSCKYSRKAALWLYNNIIVGRVPINSQSPCIAGIPKIALKESGYTLMKGLTRNLLNEIPHIFSPQSQTTYMTPLSSGNVFEVSYNPRRGMVQLSELPELKEDILHMKRVSVQYWVKAG